MQYITNMRGTRAFDPRTGKAASMALAAGVMLSAMVPALAQPAAPAPLKGGAVRVIRPQAQDVTLDFVAADINDVLKALAVQTHTNIVSGSDVKGSVTVSLAHVSLEEALNMVSHLSGFQYAKMGHSYVVGSPATIATMTAGDGLAVLPTTAVLAFNYTDPQTFTDTIKDRYPSVKVNTGKSSGQGGHSVLIVTGTDADVTAVKQLVADTESGLSNGIAGSQTVVYDIKYVSADDLMPVLSRLVPNIIVTPAPAQRLAPQAPATVDAGGATSTTTSYGAASSGAGTGGTVTAVTANLPPKPTTSSLLLTGTETDIARARQILATVDVRPAQINFSAKITEINLNSAKNLGLTYDFSGAKTTIGELIPSSIPDPTGTINPLTGQVNRIAGTAANAPDPYAGRPWALRTFGRGFITNLVTVGLDALFSSGDAKLLSSPNISAVDGQPAGVFVGDSITYVSSITTGPTGQNITTATVNAGIKLLVTGKINNDGYVTLNIHPEVSTPTFLPSIGGAVLPRISTREATTTLRVKDGDTIAIGGLISESDVKNITKVPFLGDLPFFGNLFRDTQHARNRNEIVIFVKVSIDKEAA